MSYIQCSITTGATDDAQAIAAFQIAMARETENYALDPETVQKGVERMLAMPDRGFYVVAKNICNTLISSLLVLKEWSDWRNTDVWWVHSLYVEPKHRRQGVFRHMMAYVEERARDNGVAGIRLYVERENHDAKAVYAALGMSNDHYELYEKMLH